MQGIDNFLGFENNNQQGNPEALRQFQERMKVAAQQIKAIKAGEQKQKKKEDELINILLSFIKSNQREDIIELVTVLLHHNLPASFIISLMIISNHELQKSSGLILKSPASVSEKTDDSETITDIALPFNSIPIHLKLIIDSWLSEIEKIYTENYERISLRAYLGEKLHIEIIKLATISLNDLLKQNNVYLNQQKLEQFISAILHEILKKKQHTLLNNSS